MFLDATKVGTSKGCTVECSTKGPSGKRILNVPLSQKDYALQFNTIDRND
jgi:hypothetical protein